MTEPTPEPGQGAFDDPVKLARAARILRTALARRRARQVTEEHAGGATCPECPPTAKPGQPQERCPRRAAWLPEAEP